MITNADLTIFNKFPDPVTKRFCYRPHYIEHVWFHTEQKSTVTDGSLTSADLYKIRIPYSECEDWISEEVFSEQSKQNPKWTVQTGDFFLIGKWTGSSLVAGIEEIRKEYAGVVGRVLSHSENFFGSSKHIRIGGGS